MPRSSGRPGWACSACATRWPRCCRAPRSRGSTHRSPRSPTHRSWSGPRRCAPGPGTLVAFLDLDQELFAHRVRPASRRPGCWRGGVAGRHRATGWPHAPADARSRASRRGFAAQRRSGPVMAAEEARRRVLGYPPFGAVAEVSGEPDAVRAALARCRPRCARDGAVEQGSGLAALRVAADADALADALEIAGRPAGPRAACASPSTHPASATPPRFGSERASRTERSVRRKGSAVATATRRGEELVGEGRRRDGEPGVDHERHAAPASGRCAAGPAPRRSRRSGGW